MDLKKNERVKETDESVCCQENCERWLFDKCALRRPFWDEERQKSDICKGSGSSVYYRAALNQSSRARFHSGFVSYRIWPWMAGLRQPWSTAWKQVRVGAWRVTERSRWLKQENKWNFKRVKNGWLEKCPHAVRKWPSRAGLAPIRRDERPRGNWSPPSTARLLLS